ncbi:MAG: hypothetical protein H6735_12485 [Alphaproteobacteria bacterium]|nr:hypothetical protein [Alphaproteobacteria bacterium]
MRPSRIWAVARSDWAVELKGRQGLVLPFVMTTLLLPAASVPSPLQRATQRLSDPTYAVHGDVPAEVMALPDLRPGALNQLGFRRGEDGVLWVRANVIPAEVRGVLDGDAPVVRVENTRRGFIFPGRTMLFAMVSSSTLTGAVANSIGGERSRKTLVVLLSAAISRAEIVAGKTFAWTAWGVGAACLAAGAAIAWGHVEAGAWLLPMVSVPFATVAIGMWLVRSAADVVAGTATTLRALPAALAISAVTAFLVGEWDPILGAAVPLGGALIAAGDTWEGWLPPLVATASTCLLGLLALAGTVRDLEESPEREPPEFSVGLAVVASVIGAVCWWLPVAAPLLWAPAGNPRMLEGLPVEAGARAAAICLLAVSAVRAARGGRRPAVAATPPWVWAAAVGVGLVWPWLPKVTPLPFEAAPLVAERLSFAADPPTLGLGLLVVLAQELMFRGWVQRGAGPVLATLAWTLVVCPLDPVRGLLGGALLATLAYRGGPSASLLARVVSLIVGLALR